MNRLAVLIGILAGSLLAAPAALPATATLAANPATFYPYEHDGYLDSTEITFTVKARTCVPGDFALEIFHSNGRRVAFYRDMGLLKVGPRVYSRTVTWVGNFSDADEEFWVTDRETWPYYYTVTDEFGTRKVLLVPPGTYQIRSFVMDWLSCNGSSRPPSGVGPIAYVTTALG
jgi:hypothetical protein